VSATGGDERLEIVKQLLRDRGFEEAIGILEKMVEESPDSPSLVQNLGTSCFAAGRLEEATRHFERLVQLRPTDVAAFVNLGAVLNRAGEYVRAADALRRGLQRDRRCAAAYYNLGIAHRGTKSNTMAISSYREALRIDPDMVDAHYNLANLLTEMGNTQQAILHYKEALARRPGFTKAQRGLAKAEQAANSARQAFSPFGRLVQPKIPAEGNVTGSRPEIEIVLSEEERIRDRLAVTDLVAEIALSSGELATVLRDRFEHSVAALHKVVSQGSEGAHLLDEVYEEFCAAFAEVRLARQGLDRGIGKLRAHERELHHEL
jgi:tetratricopeptide (TPR) repeat protein